MTTARGHGRVPSGALWLFLSFVFLLGGDSREDHLGLVLLYPASVLLAAIAWTASSRDGEDWQPMRTPAALLGGLAATMVIQLLPLPKAVWIWLPERLAWVRPATDAGVAPDWLPISIAPDLTLGALAALVVPAAAVILFVTAPPRRQTDMGWVLLLGILAAAVLGVAQYAAGSGVRLYLQSMISPGEVTGVLANRNHHALFLAIGIPVAVAVYAGSPRIAGRSVAPLALSGLTTLLLAAFVVIAGSRSAFLVLALGSLLSWFLLAPALTGWSMIRRIPPLARIVAVIGGLVLLLVAGAVADGRFVALDRLISGDFGDDLRWRLMPALLQMLGDHWLLGTGYGGFDTLYRIYEPLHLLQESYVNHAHNELIELWLEGGVPAIAILIAFVAWVGARGAEALRADGSERRILFARAGLIVIVQIAGASLVDYPLRTPLFQVVLVIACFWLSGASRPVQRPLPSAGSSLETPSRPRGLGPIPSARRAQVDDTGN
jgi:O-antigen ligase